MPAVVEEEEVPRAGVGDEAGEGAADVGPRGLRPRAVLVGEDPDVVLVEAEAVDEAAAHAVDVVVAALELRLGARVVDPHQHRALLPHRSRSLPFRIRRRVASIGHRRLGAARRGAGAFEEDGGRCACLAGGALDFLGGAPSCLSIGVSIWQPGGSWWVVACWWRRAVVVTGS